MVFLVAQAHRTAAFTPLPLPSSVSTRAGQQAQLVLPAFSVRQAATCALPSLGADLLGQSGARLPQEATEWTPGVALVRLEDALPAGSSTVAAALPPQALPPPAAVGPAQEDGAPPTFLMRPYRHPKLDAWLGAHARLDVPCLPRESGQDNQLPASLLADVAAGCTAADAEVPPLTPPALQKYTALLQPQQVPAGAAHEEGGAFSTFSLLNQLCSQQLPPANEEQLQQQGYTLVPTVMLGSATALGTSSSAAAGTAVHEELRRLAAECFEPAEANASGFFTLAAAAPRQATAPAVPALQCIQLPDSPPSVRNAGCVPAFLLTSRPAAERRRATVGEPEKSSGSPASCLFRLDVPVLVLESEVGVAEPECSGLLSYAGAPTSAFGSLFELPALAPPPVPTVFAPEGCTPLSLQALVQQDFTLDDGVFMLPPVALGEEESGQAESGLGLLALVQQECGAKAASVAPLSLHLDWSLSAQQGGLRSAELITAIQAANERLLPVSMAVPDEEGAFAAAEEARQRDAILAQLVAPYLLAASACLQGEVTESATLPPARRIKIDGTGIGSGRAAPPQCKRAAATAAGRPGAKPGKMVRPADAHEEMQHLLQVQGGGRGAAPPPGAAAEPSTSDDTFEAMEAYTKQNAVAVVGVALPTTHVALLRALAEDDARLLRSHRAGMPCEVLACAFPGVAPLQPALAAAAGAHGGGKGQQALVRALAAMAVIRQAASTLIHAGVSCAQLYLSHSLQELPGLRASVTAARHLAAACAQVATGQLDDNPKHPALQRLLRGIVTMTPGAKVMLVGEASTFHTLYPQVLGTGLRVCHFDREEELLKTRPAPPELAAALAAAARQADCVLVAAEHIAAGGFPAAAFQHIVVYASEPELQARLHAALADTPRPQHLLQVELPAPTAAQSGAPETRPLASIPPTAPAIAMAGGQPGAASAPPAAAWQALPPAAGASPAAPAKQPAGPAGGGLDWPLVVSSDPGRPICQRRGLYESVLQLEREGAVVVHRRLGLVDLVLSPSTALIIHDNTSAGLEFDAFLHGLAPTLERISFAFSRVTLVCEGDDTFCSQARPRLPGLLVGQPRLLAAAAGLGVALQVTATRDAEATRAVVAATAAAHLAAWRRLEPAWQYAMADVASPEEAFLTSFYPINPHTAVLLASLGLSMAQLLHLGDEPAGALAGQPPALALVPPHSLALFARLAAWGSPLLGVGDPAASACHLGAAAGGAYVAAPPMSPVALEAPLERSEEDCYPSPAQASVHHTVAPHYAMQQYQHQQLQYQQQLLQYQQQQQQAYYDEQQRAALHKSMEADALEYHNAASVQAALEQAAAATTARYAEVAWREHEQQLGGAPTLQAYAYHQQQALALQQQQQQHGADWGEKVAQTREERYVPPWAVSDGVYQQGMNLMRSCMAEGGSARFSDIPTAYPGAAAAHMQQPQQPPGYPQQQQTAVMPGYGQQPAQMALAQAAQAQEAAVVAELDARLQEMDTLLRPPPAAGRQHGGAGYISQAAVQLPHEVLDGTSSASLARQWQHAGLPGGRGGPGLAHSAAFPPPGMEAQVAGRQAAGGWGAAASAVPRMPVARLGPQPNAVDEFGLLAGAGLGLSDGEESDHGVTVAARLSPLGLGLARQQHAQSAGTTAAGILGKRRFEPPRQTRAPQTQRVGPGIGADAGEAAPRPAPGVRKPAFGSFAAGGGIRAGGGGAGGWNGGGKKGAGGGAGGGGGYRRRNWAGKGGGRRYGGY